MWNADDTAARSFAHARGQEPPRLPVLRLSVATEREKMLAGELYDPRDAELAHLRVIARDLCQKLNATPESDADGRRRILRDLVGAGGDSVWMQPPFSCDYGFNILLGEEVFFNFDCVVLDVCKVTIGSHSMFGPGVQIYSATHPMNAVQRRSFELGRPVTIGEDVWVGGGALIMPGVKIGSRVVVGAGSVVTNDLPDDVVAAENPCRILRKNEA